MAHDGAGQDAHIARPLLAARTVCSRSRVKPALRTDAKRMPQHVRQAHEGVSGVNEAKACARPPSIRTQPS
eukprot:10105745-Alexandrium_andersonii.AAC.1